MTTKEAIKFCEGYLPECDTKKFVIESLKKQMPQKPLEVGDGISYNCPSCGEYCGYVDLMCGETPEYCYHCNQALDWRIEDGGKPT